MSDEKELIIVRGSTPLLAVTLPEDLKTSDIASGIISISQRNKGVLISKTLEEMTVDGNKYSVFLKQSETLKLDSTKPAAIQAKFCTIDDVVLVSYIQNIEILPVNNEKMFEQDNPSGDTYEATGESGIEIVPDLVNFTPDIDVEQITISTDDYTLLRNKPILNGVTINGSQTSDEFGIYSSTQVDALLEPIVEKETEQDTSISEIDEKVQTIQSDVNTLKTDAVKSVNNVRPVNGNVTIAKADIGLANVTNDVQVKRSEMGAANGVATLDTNGVIPSAQLPSYVDDVLEYSTASAFPSKGESGKIYIAIDTNLSYRWSGTRYTKIASDLALGETSSTAYAGDKGKAVRDDLNTHVADNSRHITSAERTTWNGKQDKLTAGTNITIDANNVISAAGGSGGGAVDSVNGKTGVVVLDADDVGALPDTTTASDLGAYVKPSSGIPKTDLASAVQTSLGKADTALQTAPVTSVNSKTGAVSLTASDLGAYTKPSTGIPKSDLASSVQASLEKADTALQSAPVTSVNSKTGAVSLSASDVSALPDSTTIPTKTSDLTNDSGYLTAVNWGQVGGSIANQEDLSVALNAKQGKLTAGANITIDANNVISSTGGGGGGTGGHTIVDENGSAMTARGKLQFLGATVSDRPASDATVVSGLKGDKGDKGDTGDTGPQGPAGPTGETGPQGPSGSAATIAVGNVTSGSSASVVNSGTSSAAVFDFVLPKGEKGETGETGATGPTGPQGPTGPDGYSPTATVTKSGDTATITITDKNGTTSATVTDGSDATARWGNISGTLANQTDLNNALSAKANASNLTTIESSTTASQAYSTGDYLVYNGQLYAVTAAIALGETLTVGTNIASTSVGNELNNNCKSSESLTSLGNNKYNMSFNIPNSGLYVATCNCRCYGGGTYPEIISVYKSPDCSGDAVGGGVTTKEYVFVSFSMYAYFERGTHYLSFHNNVASDYFNARVALFRIGN